MKNKTNLFAIGMVFVVLIMGFSSAFAVGSSYWEGHPLKIEAGDTQTVNLILQNLRGEGDEVVRTSLSEGSTIASVEEADYPVALGENNVQVPVVVTIPEGTATGTEYKVTVSLTTVEGGPSGGGVALSIGYDTTFDVLVVDAVPGEPGDDGDDGEGFGGLTMWLIIIAAVIIVIIVVLVFVLKKKGPEVEGAGTPPKTEQQPQEPAAPKENAGAEEPVK